MRAEGAVDVRGSDGARQSTLQISQVDAEEQFGPGLVSLCVFSFGK